MIWIDQRHINFIQALEMYYKADFSKTLKPTIHFMSIYKKWVYEGGNMGLLKKCFLRGSKSVKQASESTVVDWNPLDRWDKKKLPIKWEDSNE